MRLENTPEWNPRPRRRSRLPLVLASFFCGIAVASVSITLLISGGRFGNQRGAASVPPGVTPHPLAHVPTPKAGASLPPLGAHFQIGNQTTPLATPCPVQGSAAGTSAPPASGTPTLRLSPVPTKTGSQSGIPVCGNGQRPVPNRRKIRCASRCITWPSAPASSTSV